MRRKISKSRQVLDIVVKHWRSTIGSMVILASVFALIFKQISTETLAAIVAAMIAAGYIPKAKTDDN
jgi:hypothetical protein